MTDRDYGYDPSRNTTVGLPPNYVIPATSMQQQAANAPLPALPGATPGQTYLPGTTLPIAGAGAGGVQVQPSGLVTGLPPPTPTPTPNLYPMPPSTGLPALPTGAGSTSTVPTYPGGATPYDPATNPSGYNPAAGLSPTMQQQSGLSTGQQPTSTPPGNAFSFLQGPAYQEKNFPFYYASASKAAGADPLLGGPLGNFVQQQRNFARGQYELGAASGAIPENMGAGDWLNQYMNAAGQGLNAGGGGKAALGTIAKMAHQLQAGGGLSGYTPTQIGAFYDLWNDPYTMSQAIAGAGGPTPYQDSYLRYIQNQMLMHPQTQDMLAYLDSLTA